MIIPGMSEDCILEELIEDRKIIAKEAKKCAMKIIKSLQKSGRGNINENIENYYEITPTKSNNKWNVMVIVNMTKNPQWFHRANCFAEGEHNTKDFYLLRGMSVKKPYFIKITSHALKRLRERLLEKHNVEMGFRMEDFAHSIIDRGEKIPWSKIVDFRLLKMAMETEDNHLLTTLFCTKYGCYLGYITDKGNVEFKTFLNKWEERKKVEEKTIQELCKIAHIGLNQNLYSKEFRDRYIKQELMLTDDLKNIMMGFAEKKYVLLP